MRGVRSIVSGTLLLAWLGIAWTVSGMANLDLIVAQVFFLLCSSLGFWFIINGVLTIGANKTEETK